MSFNYDFLHAAELTDTSSLRATEGGGQEAVGPYFHVASDNVASGLKAMDLDCIVVTRRWRKRSLRATRLLDAQRLERIAFPHADAPFESVFIALDTSAFPGLVLTKNLLVQEKTRDRLIALVEQFRTHGFSSSERAATKIDDQTAATSKALLRSLPKSRPLPKIAPDGEGGLLLVWDSDGRRALVVIDGVVLHLVKSPATPNAQYLDDLPFDGESIPEEILDSIP